MVIYIDAEYKCHVTDDGTMTPVETSFFDGYCAEYIEGYRYIPEGEVWIREDGKRFTGGMVAPWKPYAELENAQRNYEKQLLAEYAEALKTLGVTV